MRLSFLIFALAVAGAPVAASAATYHGTAAQPSVVWITGPGPQPVADAEIRQTQKTFTPALLVVPTGTSVKFPNDDAFYHSVYNVSPANPFDLGLYDTGPGKSVTFSNSGVAEVRCHVHGSMHATIVVVDGSYVVTTRPNESYSIAAPRGSHVMHVWTDGSPIVTTTVRVK